MREKEREQYKPTTVVCNEKNGYIMPCFSYAASLSYDCLFLVLPESYFQNFHLSGRKSIYSIIFFLLGSRY